MVKFLVDCGADINFNYELDTNTPLHAAAKNNHRSVVHYFLLLIYPKKIYFTREFLSVLDVFVEHGYHPDPFADPPRMKIQVGRTKSCFGCSLQQERI